MTQATFFDARMIYQAAEHLAGMPLPNPDQFYIGLGLGSTNFSRSGKIADLVATELNVAGYQRFNYNLAKTVSNVSAADNLLTIAEHLISANDVFILEGADLPEPLAVNTLYQALNVTSNTLQVALYGQTSAIDLTDSGSGVIKLRHCGKYNTSTQRVEIPEISGAFTTSVAANYDFAFCLANASATPRSTTGRLEWFLKFSSTQSINPGQSHTVVINQVAMNATYASGL